MTIIDLGGMAPIRLAGWGAAPAPLRYSNADLCAIFGWPPDVGEAVAAKIGTRYRHSCADLRARTQVVTAADMAVDAVTRALARAALPPSAVQAVVGVSTILDYFTPSLTVQVQKRLGLDGGLTFDLVGGCGVLAQGIFQAVQLLRAGIADTAVVVSSEPLSRNLLGLRRQWEVFAFGSGAAAMVLSTRHPGPFVLRRCALHTIADLGGCRDEVMVIPVLGPILPPPLVPSDRLDPDMPAIGYPDALRTIQRPDLAARWATHYMAAAVAAVCEGIDRGGLYLCPHQPSRVVLEGVRDTLGLAPEQVAAINPDFGNLSSASSLTAFCVRFDDGPARYPWTALAPVGTGLTCGAALFERVHNGAG